MMKTELLQLDTLNVDNEVSSATFLNYKRIEQ